MECILKKTTSGVSSTRIGVWVRPIESSHAADDVQEMNGCPSKRHAKTTETSTRLFCLKTQLLQLFLVLPWNRRDENMLNQPTKLAHQTGH